MSVMYSLFSTPDCGETWELMTVSPFSADDYSPIVPCNGLADGLHAVVAFKKNTSEMYFALYNGATWGDPVKVTTLGSSDSKAVSCFQENFAGSSRLRIVGNGFDFNSTNYGDTWEVTP